MAEVIAARNHKQWPSQKGALRTPVAATLSLMIFSLRRECFSFSGLRDRLAQFQLMANGLPPAGRSGKKWEMTAVNYACTPRDHTDFHVLNSHCASLLLCIVEHDRQNAQATAGFLFRPSVFAMPPKVPGSDTFGDMPRLLFFQLPFARSEKKLQR